MIAMHLSVLAALVLSSTPQIIDGIKPVFDPAPKYAQAYVKWFQATPALATRPDPFMAGFFAAKGKTMASLVHTRYTAAQMGICGTLVGLYDASAGAAIKAAAERITKGGKDFVKFTDDEIKAIQQVLSKEDGHFYPFSKQLLQDAERSKAQMAGTKVGVLASYVTVWHMSPKQQVLLGFISDAVKGCAEHGAKWSSGPPDLVAALKGFAPFQGKTLDEPTVRLIGAQIDATLRTTLPPNYRW